LRSLSCQADFIRKKSFHSGILVYHGYQIFYTDYIHKSANVSMRKTFPLKIPQIKQEKENRAFPDVRDRIFLEAGDVHVLKGQEKRGGSGGVAGEH